MASGDRHEMLIDPQPPQKEEDVDDAVKYLGSRGLLFIITNADNENIERIMEYKMLI